jgi:hypothetical protein
VWLIAQSGIAPNLCSRAMPRRNKDAELAFIQGADRTEFAAGETVYIISSEWVADWLVRRGSFGLANASETAGITRGRCSGRSCICQFNLS